MLKQTQEFYKNNIVNHVIKNGHFVVGKNIKIKPAVCSNIHEELESLYDKRLELYHKYKIVEDNILLGDQSEKYKTVFHDIIKELENVQNMINSVHQYHEELEDENDSSDIDQLKTQLKSLRDNAPLYVKKLIKLRELESKHHPMVSECLVKQLPKIVDDKPVDKKPEKKLSNDNKDIIKKNIKELIKSKFKAKTFDECASQKRSQPYYMKKEDIIQTIESTPQIKEAMPSNYKSLNKENLCKQLFD
jgi:hypothetical protein